MNRKTTEHPSLVMYHEPRRVTDRKLLCAMLDMTCTCTVALHDEPYPYIVPMNFGYSWQEDEGLVIYLHMAQWGHRLDLLEQDPHVAINVYAFYDRRGKAAYRNENHDYRSVTVYGKAQEVEQEDDALFVLSRIAQHSGRPALVRIPPSERVRMRLFRVRADIVTGKAQYPISQMEEVQMPVFDGE